MQVIFSTGKKWGFVSWGIRWFTKEWGVPFRDIPSHVALRFSKPEDNWMVESHAAGVQPTWWPYFSKKNHIVAAFELTGIEEKVLEDTIEEFMAKALYKKYDFLAILGFIYIQLRLKLFGERKTRNPLGHPNRFFCVEIMIYFAELLKTKSGQDIFDGEEVDREATHPLRLMQVLEKIPMAKKVIL